MVRLRSPALTAFFDRHAGWRVGPLREGAFSSRLHSERTSAILGLVLGVSFSVCFLTGLWSHLVQHPPSWLTWPSRPAGLYRVTQGVHVATGIASIPLLLAKLWAAYPKLWTWPPIADVAQAVERVSLVPLVGGSLFMIFTGTANIARWYSPMPFFFTAAHFWAAWITIGALVVHVGAKATATRRALSSSRAPEPAGPGLSRRGFLGVVASTSGLLTLATVGQTIGPLRRLSVLAPRRPDIGPQGVPVNRTAAAARVGDLARDPNYRLLVEGNVPRPFALGLDELLALPRHEAVLPISCVEGWSFSARWSGVRVMDVLERAGASRDAVVHVESLEPHGRYRTSVLNRLHTQDPDTLLALELDGKRIDVDHGYPLRLIGPNRPGVLQTKWVGRLVVR